jgi:hypothetical protein
MHKELIEIAEIALTSNSLVLMSLGFLAFLIGAAGGWPMLG